MITDSHVSCPSAAFLRDRFLAGADPSARIKKLETASGPLDLERRLAQVLIEVRPSGSTLPFERFASRPVSEDVLLRNWRDLSGPICGDLADRLVAGLTDAPARPRGFVAMSAVSRTGRRTVFASPGVASDWTLRVGEAEFATSDPFKLACHAYAEVALSHPYADGNGRLARAMFQRAFIRAGLLDAPLIPLGPLIYLNHKVVIETLVRLGTTGDWLPFLDVMARLTHKAVAFTEHHLKSYARPSPRDIDGP